MTDEVQRDTDGQPMICMGCGTTKTHAHYSRQGYLSCCPERRMVRVNDTWFENKNLDQSSKYR